MALAQGYCPLLFGHAGSVRAVAENQADKERHYYHALADRQCPGGAHRTGRAGLCHVVAGGIVRLGGRQKVVGRCRQIMRATLPLDAGPDDRAG